MKITLMTHQDVLCGFPHPFSYSLLVMKFIHPCGMNLEEPGHLIQALNFTSMAAN